ncbi:MAG: hypothetical protein Q9182_006496 [Xanthomendoza sp. 2 TL-2023]
MNHVKDITGGHFEDEEDEENFLYVQRDNKNSQEEEGNATSTGRPKKRARASTTTQDTDDVHQCLLWLGAELSQSEQEYKSVAIWPTGPKDNRIGTTGNDPCEEARTSPHGLGSKRPHEEPVLPYVGSKWKRGFWSDKQVKAMMGGKDPEAFRPFREQSDLSNSREQPRKKDIKQLVDKHDKLKDLLIYSEILKRPIEKTMKRLKGARQSVLELTEKNQGLKVKTRDGATHLEKLFHSEHRDLVNDVKQSKEKFKEIENREAQLIELMDGNPDMPASKIRPILQHGLWYDYPPLLPATFWVATRSPRPPIDVEKLVECPVQNANNPNAVNFLFHNHDFPAYPLVKKIVASSRVLRLWFVFPNCHYYGREHVIGIYDIIIAQFTSSSSHVSSV